MEQRSLGRSATEMLRQTQQKHRKGDVPVGLLPDAESLSMTPEGPVTVYIHGVQVALHGVVPGTKVHHGGEV